MRASTKQSYKTLTNKLRQCHARDFQAKGHGFDSHLGRLGPNIWAGAVIMCPAETDVMVFPLSVSGNKKNFHASILGQVYDIA